MVVDRKAAIGPNRGRSPARSTLLSLALLTLIWGSNFLWIKLAIRGLSPQEVTLARLALGAGVLFTLVAVRHEPVPRSPRLWMQIIAAALFANALPYLLLALGEQSVNSSTAGILNSTTPLWTMAVALSSGHQRRVSVRQIVGLVVGFGGTLLIFAPWGTTSHVAVTGALECLGAAASYGVSFVFMDRFLVRRGFSPLILSACQLLAASVMLAITVAATGPEAPRIGVSTLVSIAVLGLLGTGVAYVLNYRIITSEGATVASTVTYLLPIVAIVLGIAVLGEHLTLPIIAGIALVLAGVALTRTRRS